MLYFAYGSNLDQKQMRRRCPCSKLQGPACLPDHRLGFTWYSRGWGGGVADVVASPKDEVWGLVYEITRKDLKSLDRFEGYPDVYTRFRGRVNTPTGSLSNVWTYSVVQKRNFIPPTQRYLNVIREAAKKFEFPEPYQAVLERVETVKGE